MAFKSNYDCLQQLRTLYRDAMKCDPVDDESVIAWAEKPEVWATMQIAHRGWSFHAAEAVVRQCRILRNRAARAIEIISAQGTQA